ncbi:MAG: tRNA uridine-5-carboxymethylaminomethyl(34) synthesis GTPase MnmE [Bacteroidetes bacterium]|nr:tRNA uridine-5-carboxymethylaminomethyl(34) synthesis GTPase MnmE [Bacteroidota bacterium]
MKGANDTIIALATAQGAGAIAVLRLSGEQAIDLVDSFFKPRSKTPISAADTHTIHLGDLYEEDKLLDEVLVSVFRAPRSYTGENVVEISCHGSVYIQQLVLNALTNTGRCRVAEPGEFTFRAFMNGKMKLSQAEAVSDLIASESAAEHRIALQHMRGGFAQNLNEIREQLIHFAALIELELDFSGEDVEFADYGALKKLVVELRQTIKSLLDSFALGNVIKQGVPIAIIGAPNAGKSTLLNALLNEERALVSAEAGTTRDTVEDFLTIEGIRFRFIDTAGIRDTSNQVEMMGIARSFERAKEAHLVLYVIDVTTAETPLDDLKSQLTKSGLSDANILVVWNKCDSEDDSLAFHSDEFEGIAISAKKRRNLEDLKARIVSRTLQGAVNEQSGILTNSRHYQLLQAALKELYIVEEELERGSSQDLLAISLKGVIQHLGEISGSVTNDDILGSIFSSFCIGK